jgi:hypothetical protein
LEQSNEDEQKKKNNKSKWIRKSVQANRQVSKEEHRKVKARERAVERPNAKKQERA